MKQHFQLLVSGLTSINRHNAAKHFKTAAHRRSPFLCSTAAHACWRVSNELSFPVTWYQLVLVSQCDQVARANFCTFGIRPGIPGLSSIGKLDSFVSRSHTRQYHYSCSAVMVSLKPFEDCSPILGTNQSNSKVFVSKTGLQS